MNSAECVSPESDLSTEEAFEVLEQYFVAAQEVFVERGAPVERVVLEVAHWVHDGPRHFAACSESGRRIVVAPELAQLPEETVLAILSHEFGHAVDFLSPGVYSVDDVGKLIHTMDSNPDGKREAQARVARMKRWESRDSDTVERTADAIAQQMTGREIGYAGPCSLQSFDQGIRPRPKGLT